jgi:hypothetical protein
MDHANIDWTEVYGFMDRLLYLSWRGGRGNGEKFGALEKKHH